MAWFSAVSYSSGAAITNTIIENLAKDDRTLGGNVDGAGYSITNLGGIITTGNVGFGTSSPAGPLTVKVGTNKDLTFTTGVLTGVKLNVHNDAITLNVPLEVVASVFAFTGGNFGIGSAAAPTTSLGVVGGLTAPSLTYNAADLFQIASAPVALAAGVDVSAPNGLWLQGRHYSVSGVPYPLLLNPMGGFVGIGTRVPTSPLQVVGLVTYASDAAAGTGGLTAGALYKDSGGGVHVKL